MNDNRISLDGKKVAVLAVDGFEYIELIAPVLALRGAGATVDIVSLHEGRIRGVNVSMPTLTIAVDRLVEQVSVEEYDALFIPGGLLNPDLLRQSASARELVHAFDAAEKPIATICHGAWVLISASVVYGRRLAAWPSLRDDIMHAGGIWRDEPVVWDRHWISSRGPQDLAEFIPALLQLVAGARVEAQSTASSAPTQEANKFELRATQLTPGPAVWMLLGASIGIGAATLMLRPRSPSLSAKTRPSRRAQASAD